MGFTQTVVPARSFADSADTTTRARSLCQTTTAAARPFVVTPYLSNDDGELCPRMPAYGPCGMGDERACRLVLDHHRPRTTGPCFPLMVLRCTTHDLGFTLYPPGHVPYGRRAIAPVAADGSLVRGDDAGAEADDGHAAVEMAQRLRGARLRVISPVSERPMGAQLKRANKLGARFAVFVGADEIAAGTYGVKNLLTGDQESMDEATIIARCGENHE